MLGKEASMEGRSVRRHPGILKAAELPKMLVRVPYEHAHAFLLLKHSSLPCASAREVSAQEIASKSRNYGRNR
jgi:hypothetical protein